MFNNNLLRKKIMNVIYHEVMGYKQSKNGKYTVIIERNNKRKTIYTIYNNKLKTKRTLSK